MSFDHLIVNASLIDGTGAPAKPGCLGVKDGKIAAIGPNLSHDGPVIDAGGKVLCPGFVDIHTHYDAQILWDGGLSISPDHGVTTAVIGNCGFGIAPTRPQHRRRLIDTLERVEGMSADSLIAGLSLNWPFESFPSYLDAIEARHADINVAAFFGHTPLRFYVMGEEADRRAARPDEVAAMELLAREAGEAGALGFATSHATTHHGAEGRPVPSRLAELSEIITLAKATGRMMQATIGPGLFIDELGQVAAETGLTVTWTALLAGIMGKGAHRGLVAQTAAQQAKGWNVVPQVACRPLCFDCDFDEPFTFESLPLFADTMKTDHAGRMKIYADPAFRAAFKDVTRESRHPAMGWTARAIISRVPGHPEWEEKLLAVVAAEQGKDPVDFALDLSLATDLKARFRTPFLNYDEPDVAELLVSDETVIALSDAGAHASQLCDACFSTHLLGHWVREKGTLTLEDAVRRLTSRPAEVAGISGRGTLAVGQAADLVIFDPATVGAGPLHRRHDLPGGADRLVADAYGIDLVMVNGAIIRGQGVKAQSKGPGKLLRGGAAA